MCIEIGTLHSITGSSCDNQNQLQKSYTIDIDLALRTYKKELVIRALGIEVFPDLEHDLQKVVLSDNKIERMPTLPASLLVLNLDFNQLKAIEGECFNSSMNLRYLSLKHN